MMEKIRQTTLVLGEGITEFFFLNSLKDDYSVLRSVKPDYPRNTSLEDLEDEIVTMFAGENTKQPIGDSP